MDFDVIIIGAGSGGIFFAYELAKLKLELKVAVFEAGHALSHASASGVHVAGDICGR